MLETEINEYLHFGREIERLQRLQRTVRKEILKVMKENALTDLKTHDGYVKVVYAFSFDAKKCRKERQNEFKEFLNTYMRTEEVEEFDKEGFLKKYPEIYNYYKKPLTPRLSVKPWEDD